MRWTQNEVDIILKNYPTMTAKQLCKLLPNRNEMQIYSKIKYMRSSENPVLKKSCRRIDYELLKKLWNEKKPTKQIAEQVGASHHYVSFLKRKLGLKPRKRGTYGIRLKMEAEQRVFSWLQKNGGFAELKKAPSACVITRLIKERRIIKVRLSLKKGFGGYRRFTQLQIFKKDFVEKVFVCIDRTAVVRLFCKVLLKPKDRHVKYILTHYLKKHLTEAERIAVMWNLGIRNWNRGAGTLKRSIQIDGIVKPQSTRDNRKLELEQIRLLLKEKKVQDSLAEEIMNILEKKENGRKRPENVQV